MRVRFGWLLALGLFILGGAFCAQGQVGQITRPGLLFGAFGPYTPQGVIFSSAAYATHSGSWTGAASSKSGIISFWIKDTTATGAQHTIFALYDSTGAANYLAVAVSSSTGKIFYQGWNAAHTLIMSVQSVTNFASASAWSNVILSWNLATARCQVYTNDISDLTASPTCTNDTIAYAAPGTPATVLGAQTNVGATPVNANLADFQFWQGIDVDLSVTGNRRNFIDGSGNGVNPTVSAAALGTQTVLQTGTPSSWQTNQGTGGGFLVQTGTITAAASNPP